MTRGVVLDSMDKGNVISEAAYRRRTLASAELREMITSDADPMRGNPTPQKPSRDFGSIAPTSTRRMSIGEIESNDWETPRLDIEGFVVDYFTERIRQEGFEWFDAPPLPYGSQPEHEMMRSMASIFEKKNKAEVEKIAEQLLSSPKITFSIYQEVVQTLGCSSGEICPMSYGRLIGLIAFGGMLAAKMITVQDLRNQISSLALYTSLFIKSRVRASWKEHNRNWAGFMKLGASMKLRYEQKEDEDNDARQSKRRWSVIGLTAAAVFGSVIAGRMLFGR